MYPCKTLLVWYTPRKDLLQRTDCVRWSCASTPTLKAWLSRQDTITTQPWVSGSLLKILYVNDIDGQKVHIRQTIFPFADTKYSCTALIMSVQSMQVVSLTLYFVTRNSHQVVRVAFCRWHSSRASYTAGRDWYFMVDLEAWHSVSVMMILFSSRSTQCLLDCGIAVAEESCVSTCCV